MNRITVINNKKTFFVFIVRNFSKIKNPTLFLFDKNKNRKNILSFAKNQ